MTEEIQVKIIGVSGSPRKGATQYAVREALQSAEEVPGVSTEFIDLRGKKLGFCNHCNRCVREGIRHCVGNKEDDLTPEIYAKMTEADGFVFGSPVYQMTMSAQLQAFINRLRPIAPLIREGHWASRVGGAIAVGGTRHGGQETTLLAINNFFLCTGMVSVSGGVYAYNGGAIWSQDKKEEGAHDDLVGIETVRVLGRRVAFTAKMLKAGAERLSRDFEPLRFTGLRGQADVDRRAQRFANQE
ncbi:MAG TPA: flavodoxin family protein [Bacillota bacterium]